jgi:isoquinoline 1-oxidoreductase beta subunit
MNHHTKTDRRHFLKVGAVYSSALLIAFTVPGARRLAAMGMVDNVGFTPNAFLRIGTDGEISILLARVEMGQGMWTTLTMLIADELDADWNKLVVAHAPVAKAYAHTAAGIQITGGSSSTRTEFDRYRQAGAMARVLLVQAAAEKFGVNPADCRTENGVVFAGDKQATYGELALAAAALPTPAEVPLKTAKEWKYIGKGAKRLDTPVKINGTAIFGMDIRLPGMLIAVVAHCPLFGGKVKSFDAAKSKAIPGVRQVVAIPGGVAVLADNYWAAQKGREALKVQWDPGTEVPVDTVELFDAYRKLADTPGLTAATAGDPDAAFSKAAKIVEAEYLFPYLAHATMEPMNCTIQLTGKQCEIWTGTQLPGFEQAAAAKILGLEPEQVKVNTVFLGGAFGRRASAVSDYVSEAAHIVKASDQQTVKMIWSREDDMRAGSYRPAFLHKVKAAINAEGIPVAWKHIIVGQSLSDDTITIDIASVEGISDSPYLKAIPDHYVGLHSPKNSVPVLWWRSVGNTHTAAVMETMIDELAHAAGKDPLAYRQLLLKDHPRHLTALNLAAEKAGWGTPLAAGRFRGMAVHESFASFAAQVVEISINEDGTIKVHRVVCAIDCGLAVNPDGVKAQIEGGINFGISGVLLGEITLEKGYVKQSNFHDYVVARMHDTPPDIEVHIVDSNGKMGGVGEPGVPPVAPAIANAVFVATGIRLRDMPFSKFNLKA